MKGSWDCWLNVNPKISKVHETDRIAHRGLGGQIQTDGKHLMNAQGIYFSSSTFQKVETHIVIEKNIRSDS